MASSSDITVQSNDMVEVSESPAPESCIPNQTEGNGDIQILEKLNGTLGTSQPAKSVEEFGLGRGVDVTIPGTFSHKLTFLQVLPAIDSENMIVSTNEGGAVRTTCTIHDISDAFKVEISASVTSPNTPIEIGAAAEHNWSTGQKSTLYLLHEEHHSQHSVQIEPSSKGPYL